MMNRNNILILVLFAFLLGGCEDYLEVKNEDATLLSEEDVWRDRAKITSVAYRLYDCTSSFFESRYDWDKDNPRFGAGRGKNYANITLASGECLYTRSTTDNTKLIPGDWKTIINDSFANPDFWDTWENMWEAVYVSNVILDKIDGVTEDIMPEDERVQIKGEAYLFRALAYHEISKRWGAMPYFKGRMLPDMNLDVERPNLSEQIEDIVMDCDSAIKYLPVASWLNHPVNMGRMGKAAAMGLKSRALTTAASPNYTPNNVSDQSLWERAAVAAWDLISYSRSEANVGLYEGEYNYMFHTEAGTIEGIWPRYFREYRFTENIYNLNWAWTRIGGYHGYSPTQEMVDMFEMSNGYPISHASSGYNEQDPYTNRDPRFYKDILYHGALWSTTGDDQPMDMRTDPLGVDRSPVTGNDFGNSKTGYLVRKTVPDKWNKNNYNNPKYINAPYMRLAEIYLNYAEAVNEAFSNPSAMAPGADLSAIDALNVIRNRVGQADVPAEFTSDANAFRERVRNEFKVELCFEYHTWFDLLRWRDADWLNGYNFHGVKIIDDATQPTGVRFERYEIPIIRKFEDRQYRYPLRDKDLYLYKNLKQNPGWE